MNTLTTVGSYYQSGTIVPANAPASCYNAFILVSACRSTDRLQIWATMNYNTIYYRYGYLDNGVWSWGSWERLVRETELNAVSNVIPKSFYRTITGSGYYNSSIYDSSIKAGEKYVGFWTDAHGIQKHLIYTATAGQIEFGDANTLKQGADIIAIQVKSKN